MCNVFVTSQWLGTPIRILSYGINMMRSVMILFFVINKKNIPSDPMAQNNVENELRGKEILYLGFLRQCCTATENGLRLKLTDL